MTRSSFDVVIVADFSDQNLNRFETLTLFFLASWLEFGGSSRELPLHIACIGDPPDTVKSLAGECNALISIHSPILFGGFANKLRGFDVDRKTDHLLLLDSDMLILSSIHQLLEVLGENCISASATNGPCIVPPKEWREVHEMLSIPYPEQQVVPLNKEVDCFLSLPYRDWEFFPPYYNGGIVFSPWDSGLGEIWRGHLIKITEIAERKAKRSNQPSLCTAITYLQTKGVNFQLLPDEYHVRWQHIASGAVTSKNAKLMHTIGFGRWQSKGEEPTAKQDINAYRNNILKSTIQFHSHHSIVLQCYHRTLQYRQIRDCYRVYETLHLLYKKYVQHYKQ